MVFTFSRAFVASFRENFMFYSTKRYAAIQVGNALSALHRLCVPKLGIVGVKGKGKGKAIPLQAWTGPEGLGG
jgi:hypothetical protein